METVYKDLARHLDNTPGGFPATESGVELRILSQLFTPDEAELALCLVMMPEPVEAVAKRAQKSAQGILPTLKEMGEKGLILHIKNRTGTRSCSCSS